MGPQTVAPTLQEDEPPAIPARRDSLGNNILVVKVYCILIIVVIKPIFRFI